MMEEQHDQDAQVPAQPEAAADETMVETPTPTDLDAAAARDVAPASMQVPPPPGSGEAAQRNAVQLARASAIRDIGRSIARIITWVVVLALAVLLGFGIVSIYPQIFDMVVTPVEDNTRSVADLERQVGELQDEIDALTADLEAVGDIDFTEQETALTAAQESFQSEVDDLQFQIDAAEARLDSAEESLQVDAASVENLSTRLDEFLLQIDAMQKSLDAVPDESLFIEYNRQLLLMRGWQELAVARIRLAESNAGLAANHIALSRQALQAAFELSNETDQASIGSVIDALDRAETNLGSSIPIAFAEIDTAWAQLSGLIEPVPLTYNDGAVVDPVEEPTPTPEPGDGDAGGDSEGGGDGS